MADKVVIEKNAYYDSVTLMSLSEEVSKEEGIEKAVVSMGTDMNKELLGNIGLLTEEAAGASENDLIIAVKTQSTENVEEVYEKIKARLQAKKSPGAKSGELMAANVEEALEVLPDANIAIVSVKGEFAAREAWKALRKGLHVMIFSDNVPVAAEKALKEYGRAHGLLVMGPDCGTSLVNGIGLCFANEVRRGPIGVVAASGTGLQEVTVQIDRLGYGISQGIGVGGRDLSREIGGIMMLEGMKMLDKDPTTEVIVLVSKPPAAEVQEAILDQVRMTSKPVVICFLDGNPEEVEQAGAVFTGTLFQAAHLAIQVLTGEAKPAATPDLAEEQIQSIKSRMADSQKYIRGLFCGGTLTSEALSILRPHVGEIRSNVAKKEKEKLEDVEKSLGHTLLDMGDDYFTRGRPHPMIEPALRNERILQEAADPETAVLLLDFELGYGSHEDPVGSSYETIRQARQMVEEAGRQLPIVAYICGTYADKQNFALQEQKLRDLQVHIAQSNEQAAHMALAFL